MKFDGTKIESDHANMVAELVKPGTEIYKTITPLQLHDLHMIMGICEEAGELLDAFKKAIIYNKPLDTVNVVEELGDLEFYLQGLRHSLGVSRNSILQQNINKLRKRYGYNYTDQKAHERLDKQ